VEPRANLPAEYLIANAAVIFMNARRERARLRIHVLAPFYLEVIWIFSSWPGKRPRHLIPGSRQTPEMYRTGIETAVRAITAGQLTDAPYRDVTPTA
jgi:hypothetical protein